MTDKDVVGDESDASRTRVVSGGAEVVSQESAGGPLPEAGLLESLASFDAMAYARDKFNAAQNTAVKRETSGTPIEYEWGKFLTQITIVNLVADTLNKLWNERFSEAERRWKSEWFTSAVRSTVLLLVVLVIVGTPLSLILRNTTTPEQFAQYMAPVTGIAGTVIGYWFGKYEPKN